ncbi:RagB/SusD family nutrient uptake outer membrane protein [Pedobacter sp. MC2016-24]|uniref:RagB/SusD family nutrient uptake outer membrane protein n=1 Tax=Pedobacter sp. MC2016-24 TaxID=2780090 RepID=UPI0018819E26|nr:RagB/SusD family nutrient uptake outer membrane protein [Pedobacter sp. MC2016-24]MBE9599945.1 RagB/SusD family nutrient uptake outer membrane protein [Pedobacter sp. MC2016-24]
MKPLYLLMLLLLSGLLFSACQKEFLDKKPDKGLLIPKTLDDFNALMDNLTIFNISPALQEISADDFYATDAALAGFTTAVQKNSYLWAGDLYQNEPCTDWNFPYQQIFYANIILDGLEGLKGLDGSTADWNTTKGSALFHRAFAFYNLVQLFSKPFDKNTASIDLGVCLRLTADVNAKAGRASVQEVYDQVIGDLLEAENLLPQTTQFKSRPSRAAADALLARVYLNMENYELADRYAAAALVLNHSLLDYNTISPTATNPFPSSPAADNPEVIFYDKLIPYGFTTSTKATVADELYLLYADKDLRKSIFFAGTAPFYFKGRYGSSRLQLFGGLAVDELYLIRAESLARMGSFAEAIKQLNTLLITRWTKGTFQASSANDAEDALKIILKERRKELVFRGLRWGDLKRLNKDPRFAKAIVRTVAGQVYTLSPGDKRYVLPIPAEEIVASGIKQNER